MTQTLEPGATAEATPIRKPRRTPRRTRRKPVRRLFIVSHRWLSLLLGLVLLVITTSGSVVLYRPEIERAVSAGAYDARGGESTVDIATAARIVTTAHPDFEVQSVWLDHGVYAVHDEDGAWTVDPATGDILGHVGTPGWLQWTDNLHECFLSCAGEPGTLTFLTEEVPGSGWAGFEGAKITWGGLVLGSMALLLLYLSLTGIWLWFPRPRQWRGSMRVRWKRGRFARDTDLHKVAGMIVIPLLLMWAVTGAGYELGFVEKGWYAATPGKHVEGPDPVSTALPKGEKAPDIDIEEAASKAQALHPGLATVGVNALTKGDPTSAYIVYFADGFDPYGNTQYPGDLGVFVDRHTGVATDFYGGPGNSVSQKLWEDWNYPTHSGYIVNGWWRLIWLAFGLSPVLLAITGVSTWLVRRRTRRQRAQAKAAGRATPPVPTDVAEELTEDPESAPDLAEKPSISS